MRLGHSKSLGGRRKGRNRKRRFRRTSLTALGVSLETAVRSIAWIFARGEILVPQRLSHGLPLSIESTCLANSLPDDVVRNAPRFRGGTESMCCTHGHLQNQERCGARSAGRSYRRDMRTAMSRASCRSDACSSGKVTLRCWACSHGSSGGGKRSARVSFSWICNHWNKNMSFSRSVLRETIPYLWYTPSVTASRSACA